MVWGMILTALSFVSAGFVQLYAMSTIKMCILNSFRKIDENDGDITVLWQVILIFISSLEKDQERATDGTAVFSICWECMSFWCRHRIILLLTTTAHLSTREREREMLVSYV